MSVYNEQEAEFSANLKDILSFDNITDLSALDNPKVHNIVKDAMDLVDVIVKGDEFLEGEIDNAYESAVSEKGDFLEPESIDKVYN